MEHGNSRTTTLFALAVPLLITALVVNAPPSRAQVEQISSPGKIPLIRDFTTPTLAPGESGTLNFTLRNRYINPMRNVTLHLEFYRWGEVDEKPKEISRIRSPPCIVSGEASGNAQVHPNGDTPEITYTWDALSPDSQRSEPYSIRMRVVTYPDTPEGVYFMRMELRFDYLSVDDTGGHYIMRSRGYFTDEQWDRFEEKTNLTDLGVDGILPDTSLSVRGPVSRWPLIICGSITLFFGVLAALMYATDELGRFPALKELFDRVEEMLRRAGGRR